MGCTVKFSLALVAITGLILIIVYLIIPNPEVPEDAPDQAEIDSIIALMKEADEVIPQVEFRKIRPNNKRVVIIEAKWLGTEQPERADQDGWNKEADKVAEVIAEQYLPAGWQVTVNIFKGWFKVMGVAGRPSALDGPEGWLKPVNEY
jgi:hypothetical protein